MWNTLLLDLDDTLLCNNMEDFIPAYFRALTDAFVSWISPDRLLELLMLGIEAMDRGDGQGPSNEEAFSSVFYPAVGLSESVLKPVFERFYAEEFPRLRSITRPVTEARPVVELAFSRGWRVVIATHPVFPRSAVEQRLDWAGVPVSDFAYDLVTSIENMHATKASSAYYFEVLAKLGCRPRECLMVGDDWERDMLPAADAGIPVFSIEGCGGSTGTVSFSQEEAIPENLLYGRGTLKDLLDGFSGNPPPEIQ
jgi:HAD superfamily hydrolase (TIGR01549 family)